MFNIVINRHILYGKMLLAFLVCLPLSTMALVSYASEPKPEETRSIQERGSLQSDLKNEDENDDPIIFLPLLVNGHEVVDTEESQPIPNDNISEAEGVPRQKFGDELWAEEAQNFEAFSIESANIQPPSAEEWHEVGRWGDVLDWPHIATGASNLPDGRILTFAAKSRTNYTGGGVLPMRVFLIQTQMKL